MRQLTFPSKTFLVGEYAVLDGNIDAFLLGHPPCFEATFTPGPENSSPFHPESPAGRWLKSAPPLGGAITFKDAHFGRGGFGGSGAEFLAAWAATRALPESEQEREAFAWQAWRDSRAFPGSGADIATQAFGVNRQDAFVVRLRLAEEDLREIHPRPSGSCLSLFHTGKKLATHEQSRPAQLPIDKLANIAENVGECLESGDAAGLGAWVQDYGEVLASLGLLAPHSASALHSLRGVKNVWGAKGCGAMGADVILVVHENAGLEAWARENSLAPVGRIPV